MADYTANEIVNIIICYGASGESARGAAALYAERFPDRRTPGAPVILRVIARARQGNLGRQRVKRRWNDPDDNEIMTVLAMVFMRPHISQRQICRQLNLSYGTVNRILKANHFHAYHITLHQDLREDDPAARLRFCRWAQTQIANDNDFFNSVMFSDEATFKNDGTINRHNSHYYSQEQPYWTRQIDFQHRWSLNVWCGIMGDHLIGPHIFEERLNGQTYLRFLQEDLPALLENIPLATRQRMWLQQDGAPAHFVLAVRRYLNAVFPERWIGRGSTIAWPPRSPDLTPPDFSSCGDI